VQEGAELALVDAGDRGRGDAVVAGGAPEGLGGRVVLEHELDVEQLADARQVGGQGEVGGLAAVDEALGAPFDGNGIQPLVAIAVGEHDVPDRPVEVEVGGGTREARIDAGKAPARELLLRGGPDLHGPAT
jgi:hypothetical protein